MVSSWGILQKHFIRLSIYVFLIACSPIYAQDFVFSEENPITIATTLSFQSKVLNEERTLYVSLPNDYLTSNNRYPVVYILDAQYFFLFQYTYGVIKALEFLDKIPQVILVGVYSKDREKDLVTLANSGDRGGDPDKFIEFFKNELQIFIDKQYRTQPYKTLIGHSAGGLFALRTLIHTPDTFDAYIAIDPALAWNEGEILGELTEAFSADHRYKNTLFTSVSEVSDQYYVDFIKLISANLPEGLAFSHENFPNESHSSTIIPGFQQGLLAVYKDWVPPETISNLEGLLSYYQLLSAEYGYTVSVRLKHASDLGFKLIRNNDPEGALEIFEYVLTNLSQDAIAHYSVGFALMRLGRLTEALTKFNKAIELGAGTDMYPAFVSFRDTVAEQIKENKDASE